MEDSVLEKLAGEIYTGTFEEFLNILSCPSDTLNSRLVAKEKEISKKYGVELQDNLATRWLWHPAFRILTSYRIIELDQINDNWDWEERFKKKSPACRKRYCNCLMNKVYIPLWDQAKENEYPKAHMSSNLKNAQKI